MNVISAGLQIPNAEWLFNRLDSAILAVYPKDVYRWGTVPSADHYMVAMSNKWGKAMPIGHSLKNTEGTEVKLSKAQ